MLALICMIMSASAHASHHMHGHSRGQSLAARRVGLGSYRSEMLAKNDAYSSVTTAEDPDAELEAGAGASTAVVAAGAGAGKGAGGRSSIAPAGPGTELPSAD